MDYRKYKTTLELLKFDFGISNTKKDAYYNSLFVSVEKELSEQGIELDLSKDDDAMLLADYAAWRYRNRQNNIGISKNLRQRIQQRKLKRRSKYGEVLG